MIGGRLENRTFITLLRSRGKRVTPQRMAVLEVVEQSQEHLSAEQVYERVRQQLPHISLATVYKALGELRDVGRLDVVPVSGKLRYDAADRPSHHHLVCERCKKIVDVPPDADFSLPALDETSSMGFDIVRAEITFKGICPDCRKQLEAQLEQGKRAGELSVPRRGQKVLEKKG
ncbi:MAG: Fur family transcriptional regulator [Actinomycetota bacterium]|nr:transcriptional repressor [Actinomycetota bacterium]